MRYIILLILLFLSWTINGQVTYLQYPDYDIVINKFFVNYSIKDRPGRGEVMDEVTFAKEPSGWHIIVTDLFPYPKIVKDELFWNRKTNQFIDINFEKLSDSLENQMYLKMYLENWLKRYYRFCPYYGYPSWDLDVIEEFKNVANLPDSTLYALGRAYSSCASNLLNDGARWHDPSQRLALPPGKNCLNKEQLKKYRYLRHHAIECFQMVTKLNPRYETLVGAIGIKTANEYLTSFLELRIYQNEQEAKKEIIDGLYSEFLIASAKNYLNSCAPNSILLTNGDNGTYPLLYVQAQYGYRTDVLVVNLDFLSSDRYTNSLREKILDAKGLPISLTPEEIRDKKREVILIQKKGEDVIDINALVKFVKDDRHVLTDNDSITYYYIPSNKFRFTENGRSMEWNNTNNYLYRNQLIVIDMIATNNWSRPVYFNTCMRADNYFGLDNYMVLEGLVYRLSSNEKDISDDHIGSINIPGSYSNLMEKFDWSGVNKVFSHEKFACSNYRYFFYLLADAFIKENKPDSARLVLDRFIKKVPNGIVCYDYYIIPFIECYYKLKEFDKGNKIANQLFYNLINHIDDYNDIEQIIFTDQREAAIEKLKELALLYNQQEILNLFDK
jgi:hypothetical protein